LSQLDQQDSERHQEELRKLENEKVRKITVWPVWNTVLYCLIHKTLFLVWNYEENKFTYLLKYENWHCEKFLYQWMEAVASGINLGFVDWMEDGVVSGTLQQ
jgi:hypothetical protein